MSSTSIFRAGCLGLAMLVLVVVVGRKGTDRADGDAEQTRTSAVSRHIAIDESSAKWAALRRSQEASRQPVATPITEKQLVRDGHSALSRLAARFFPAAAARNAAAARDAAAAQERQALGDREAADRRAAQDRQAAILEGQAVAVRRARDLQAAHELQAASRPMPTTTTTTTLPPQAPAPAPLPVGPSTGGLVTVRGITVDASIANNLEALMASADAAGISLAGAGYRDPAAQRRLRELHCPDPVNSPPSACTPTTAKPGQSMHEKGLAIDFTSAGTIIGSHSSAAFQWLAANAGRFGFQNLPSEPWHWSVNGQ